MTSELSRRLARIPALIALKLGGSEREAFVRRIEKAETWADLSDEDRKLVRQMEKL